MKKIEKEGVVYAIYDSLSTLEKGFVWYGKNTDAMQVARMYHDKGKAVKTHRHKFHPRSLNYTQECVVLIRGKIEFSFYDKEKAFLDKMILNPGDLITIYNGYHGMEVLEDDTVYFEIKNGPFISLDVDKEFME